MYSNPWVPMARRYSTNSVTNTDLLLSWSSSQPATGTTLMSRGHGTYREPLEHAHALSMSSESHVHVHCTCTCTRASTSTHVCARKHVRLGIKMLHWTSVLASTTFAFVDWGLSRSQAEIFTMKTVVSIAVLAALCLSVQAAPSTFSKDLNETAKVEATQWTDCSKWLQTWRVCRFIDGLNGRQPWKSECCDQFDLHEWLN